MALRNTDTTAEYPYVFMIEQSIFQKRLENANNPPTYCISIAWTYYKVEEDGTAIFIEAPAVAKAAALNQAEAGSGNITVHYNLGWSEITQ